MIDQLAKAMKILQWTHNTFPNFLLNVCQLFVYCKAGDHRGMQAREYMSSSHIDD